MTRWSSIAVCACLFVAGCAAPAVRSQSPEAEEMEAASKVKLVGELAATYGLHTVEIDAIGLVTGLDGTGSDPAPSPERAALLADMQARGVAQPNQVLASPDTSLVLVRGYLRPGIQPGDKFDLEVRIPSRSETTSLAGGWLMETRLKEMAMIGSRLHDGHVLALAQGAVLVEAPATAGKDSDNVMQNRGRILGGGVALKPRPLGLVLKPGKQSVSNSSLIGTAINQRFHTFNQGVKEGVATPKTDDYIEIVVHPRYKDNIPRYLQVLRSVPLRETPTQQMARLALLERQMLDPVTASTAALRLEALGKRGIDVLAKGIESKDLEVRFYAAEALAYLDDKRAVEPLVAAAKNESAFRVFALTALSAMDDLAAYEGLRGLLDVSSAETRYGAFRSLWAMNSQDSLVSGEYLGGQFSYHVLDTSGPPLIHVTRSYRPEVVVFGADQRLQTPFVLEAGKQIMVICKDDGDVVVSRFAIGKDDQKRVVTNRVDDIIRAIVELGGTYPDVVDCLQKAVAARSLTSRFAVDAVPQAGRTYDRVYEDEALADSGDGESVDGDVAHAAGGAHEGEGVKQASFVADGPVPDLFAQPKEKPDRKKRKKTESSQGADAKSKKTAEKRRWFGKL
ncbi:MAG: flagellar basal body P-ring protein FlgI [Pirellulales bacterium]|nr:flagellar basal body P-ring protein FlgI [Pirellulales bacterium]